MTRIEGWEAALAAAIEEARARPFAWGVHDCATWVSDVRRAMTGHDAAAAWRGLYKSPQGARRAMRQTTGAETLAASATVILGDPLESPMLAQRGDIVLRQVAFGICLGRDCAFLSKAGLAFLPLTETDVAWKV